jgi:hypothetical protein
MRLTFRSDGTLAEYYAVTPETPAPAAPMVSLTWNTPILHGRGLARGCRRTGLYAGGKVCLDGAPYTPPTIRTPVTYTQALAGIAAASTVAQLREILYRICDEFLGAGALEL